MTVSTELRAISWLHILTLLVLVHLPVLCSAQSSTSTTGLTVSAAVMKTDISSTTTTNPSSTSSAPVQTHTVQVGLADHKYQPDTVQANVGDTVEFRFYPANHSVVRASYGHPCVPYELIEPGKQGFFSGFNAMDTVLDDPPKYSVKVNTTDPVFFYCSAPGSCITYGMVGAINPNSSTPIERQRDLAQDSAYMLNPGEAFPAESPLASPSPSSTPAAAQGTRKHGLAPGVIAGIVIGAISVVVLAALLFFFWGRTKTLRDEVERKESTVVRHSSPSDSNAPMLNANAGGLGIFQHYTSPETPQQVWGSPGPSYFSPVQKATSPVGHPAYAPPSANTAGSHRSVGGTFELSPSGLYSRTSQQLPHGMDDDARLGPYGQQVVSMREGLVPPPQYGWHVVQQGPAEMDATPMEREQPKWEEVEREEGKMF